MNRNAQGYNKNITAAGYWLLLWDYNSFIANVSNITAYNDKVFKNKWNGLYFFCRVESH